MVNTCDTGAAEGCSPPQELEKADRRAAIFLVVFIKTLIYTYIGSGMVQMSLTKILKLQNKYFEEISMC